MPKTWEIFDKANLLIKAGYANQARTLIEEIILREPQNIEAWEMYICMFNDRSELENLKKKIFRIWKSCVRDKDYLMANRTYILRYLDKRIENL